VARRHYDLDGDRFRATLPVDAKGAHAVDTILP